MKRKLLFSICFGIAVTFSSSIINAQETDSTMTAPALSAAPVVDGTIDAVWDNIPYTQMHNKIKDGAFDDEDYMVQFKIGWIGDMIYILVDVTDDEIVTNTEFGSHLQDYTMIILDFIYDSASYKDVNSFWYRKNADNTMLDGRFDSQWAVPAEGVTGVSAAKTNGYVVEYEIDATKFEIDALAADMEFGFNLETGDNDDPDTPQRTSQSFWSVSSEGNDWSTPIGEVGYVTLTEGSSAVRSNKAKVLSIYPNPTTNSIRISESASVVEIYNITGGLVRTFKNVEAKSSLSINQASGVYLVKATLKNGSVATQRLVVK